MEDKRAVVLGPPEPEEAKKSWKRSITTEGDRVSVLCGLNELDEFFEYSQKLQTQITSLMVSLHALQKNDKVNPKSFQNLSDRLRPLVALKENLDVFICQTCEVLLDNMDAEWEAEEDDA